MVDGSKLSRIVEAYKHMAETAIYRPQAPGDSMGHVHLTEEQ